MHAQKYAHMRVCAQLHSSRHTGEFAQEFLARIRHLMVAGLLFSWLIVEMKNALQYDKDLYASCHVC